MAELIKVRRSQLGRVRGLGAAHAGVEHWWKERVSALALVPLTLWFVFSVLSLLGADQTGDTHDPDDSEDVSAPHCAD